MEATAGALTHRRDLEAGKEAQTMEGRGLPGCSAALTLSGTTGLGVSLPSYAEH